MQVLSSPIFLHHEADAIIVCGDLNARIGNVNEVNDCIDGIPHRSSKTSMENLLLIF
jgi:hypothetical protein